MSSGDASIGVDVCNAFGAGIGVNISVSGGAKAKVRSFNDICFSQASQYN